MKNEKQIIAGAIVAAIIVMAVAVFPFWNLIPKEVTEKVKVVAVDESGCTAETFDKFIVKQVYVSHSLFHSLGSLLKPF